MFIFGPGSRIQKYKPKKISNKNRKMMSMQLMKLKLKLDLG
jgi:hypothetical protein